jgi:hypothetical protein
MGSGVTSRHGETTQHARLKQLAFIWAQTHGFSTCAMEVTLPRCRYRADVAGYRSVPKEVGSTAVFECKQALCDLRQDNCRSECARRQIEAICNRRQVLEARLRTHYPNLHNGDSLFPEFDSENFSAIGHRGYARLVRELRTLQNRLYDCTKFEKLIRYRCANLFFIVLPEQYSANRKCLSAGASWSNQTTHSYSSANQCGTRSHRPIACTFCTELLWREPET